MPFHEPNKGFAGEMSSPLPRTVLASFKSSEVPGLQFYCNSPPCRELADVIAVVRVGVDFAIVQQQQEEVDVAKS